MTITLDIAPEVSSMKLAGREEGVHMNSTAAKLIIFG